MYDEMEEVDAKDINNFYYVKELAEIFHISTNTVYKMLKSIKPKKYKIKAKTNISYAYFVLVSRDCQKQFEHWIANLGISKRRKKYKDDENARLDNFNEKIEKQEQKESENIKELRKLHPLVTDDRFFRLSYFPDVQLQEI